VSLRNRFLFLLDPFTSHLKLLLLLKELILLHLLSGCDSCDLVKFLFLQPTSGIFKFLFQLGFKLEKLFEGYEDIHSYGVKIISNKLNNISFASKCLIQRSCLLLHPELRSFESKTVGNLELVPNYHSSCVIFGLLLRKLTHIKIKNWLDRSNDFR